MRATVVAGNWPGFVHPQVMREPWPGQGDALGRDGAHQLADARTHDIPDLLPRNGEADDGGFLRGGLHDLWCAEHEESFPVGDLEVWWLDRRVTTPFGDHVISLTAIFSAWGVRGCQRLTEVSERNAFRTADSPARAPAPAPIPADSSLRARRARKA